MGGRGAHENRDEYGRMKVRGYYTVGFFQKDDKTEKDDKAENEILPKIIEADVKITKGATGMPSYSNSPEAIYMMVDHQTGLLERIRVYHEYKATVDFDYHLVDGKMILHQQTMDFDKGQKGHSRKTGREHGHGPITDENKEKYGFLIDMLGKKPEDIPSYKPRVPQKKDSK